MYSPAHGRRTRGSSRSLEGMSHESLLEGNVPMNIVVIGRETSAAGWLLSGARRVTR
jgi:hypothetical protein